METTPIDMVRRKGEILRAALHEQEKIIADFQKRIKDSMATVSKIQTESFEGNQQTCKPEVLAEIDILKNELEVATRELEQMRKIDCATPHAKVEYGSVVETDKGNYFISAGFKDFKVTDKSYCALSVFSPTYIAMKDKRAGDSFRARNVQYTIRSIF